MDGKLKTPESQRNATKKYLSKFVDVKIRVSLEERDALQRHAAFMNESANTFIKRAIAETMERDKQKKD